jgi:hypothetical protein
MTECRYLIVIEGAAGKNYSTYAPVNGNRTVRQDQKPR